MSKIPHFIDKTFEPAVVTHSAGDTYSWNVSPELPSPWQDSSVPETGPTIRSQSRVMVQRVTGSFIYRRDREILLGSVCWSSSQITPCVVGSSWVLVGSKWRSAGEKIPDLSLHLLGGCSQLCMSGGAQREEGKSKAVSPLGLVAGWPRCFMRRRQEKAGACGYSWRGRCRHIPAWNPQKAMGSRRVDCPPKPWGWVSADPQEISRWPGEKVSAQSLSVHPPDQDTLVVRTLREHCAFPHPSSRLDTRVGWALPHSLCSPQTWHVASGGKITGVNLSYSHESLFHSHIKYLQNHLLAFKDRRNHLLWPLHSRPGTFICWFLHPVCNVWSRKGISFTVRYPVLN